MTQAPWCNLREDRTVVVCRRKNKNQKGKTQHRASTEISDCNHRGSEVTASLRLEKTSKTMKSNHHLSTTLPAKPCPQEPHPDGFWTPPGLGTPPPPRAARSAKPCMLQPLALRMRGCAGSGRTGTNAEGGFHQTLRAAALCQQPDAASRPARCLPAPTPSQAGVQAGQKSEELLQARLNTEQSSPLQTLGFFKLHHG